MTSDGEVQAHHYATGQPVRVRWSEGTITHVEPAPPPLSSEVWIAPGLFDIQINGFGGIDFQQDNVREPDLLAAVRRLRAAGCARFLLTLITDDWPKLTSRLRHLRAIRSQNAELQSAIAGWHVEGPFLSAEPGFHGAHNPSLMRDPEPEHMLELRTITGTDPLLLTLSPERRGSLEAITLAVSRGVKVSLGHTDAPANILNAAIEAGASCFTHLANGCPRELDRHDNILWRVFETPGLFVSLIPDRIHVSPPLLRLIHRIVDPARIIYTTDAMSAAGMPPGRYRLGRMELEVGADQVVRQPGKPLFAGSALRPIEGVFRAAEMLGVPWQKVWPGFSERPANLMGLRSELVVGQPANFCVINASGNKLVNLEVHASGAVTR